ncbi:ATP-binding protein [Micromonospora sp. NPDC049044]|uniref:ATP-binding protein n=1 Tax=unclassified Micromonospora TaxID=2617518 RepID=UPI0033E29453
MSVPVNPYRNVGRVATGDEFIGRHDLVRHVQSAWVHPGRPTNVRVMGHHRTGKTSLAMHALATSPVERTDMVTVVLNVGSHASGDDLFRSMTKEVLREMRARDNAEPHGKLVDIDAAVQAAEAWYDIVQSVRDFFCTAADQDQYTFVVLDDFDRAATVFTQLAEFQLLRELASEPRFPLGLMTMSRRPIESIEIDAAGGSILGGVLTTTRYVVMFNDEEVDLTLARAAAAGVGLAAVRDDILDKCGRHPFLLQLLANGLVELHQETGRVDVDAAHELVAPEFDSYFRQLATSVAMDMGEKGTAALRRLAGNVYHEKLAPELMRLRLMGVLADDGQLFSAAFARYVRASHT